MTNILTSSQTILGQAVRLLQMAGIPIFGFLLIIGLILLLTAGKNPRRKRAGYILSIISTIAVFIISYVPLLAFKYTGSSPKQAASNETIQQMVNSSSSIGTNLFTGLRYGAIPLTFTMFYVGIIIVLMSAKSPQRKRLGIGIMIFSPLVLSMVYIVPKLLPMM